MAVQHQTSPRDSESLTRLRLVCLRSGGGGLKPLTICPEYVDQMKEPHFSRRIFVQTDKSKNERKEGQELKTNWVQTTGDRRCLKMWWKRLESPNFYFK